LWSSGFASLEKGKPRIVRFSLKNQKKQRAFVNFGLFGFKKPKKQMAFSHFCENHKKTGEKTKTNKKQTHENQKKTIEKTKNNKKHNVSGD
jgi:hypothetical protein